MNKGDDGTVARRRMSTSSCSPTGHSVVTTSMPRAAPEIIEPSRASGCAPEVATVGACRGHAGSSRSSPVASCVLAACTGPTSQPIP